MNGHDKTMSVEWLNFHFLKVRCRHVLHWAFDVKFGIGPGKEGAHRDPDLPQCFRGQVARVPAPSTRNIFSSHIDEIRVDVTVGKLGNLLIPRIVCPLIKNSFVRIHGSLGQSLGCFVVNKASNCRHKGQPV
jgi:hypothetical protein